MGKIFQMEEGKTGFYYPELSSYTDTSAGSFAQ